MPLILSKVISFSQKVLRRHDWRLPSCSARIYSNDACGETTSDTTATVAGGGAPVGDAARPKRAMYQGKVRMGIFPEEWFTFFYKKTGVTGPYMLGVSFGTYLFSKEIYVMEHEYYSGLSMMVLCYLVVTKVGPEFGASLYKEIDAMAEQWDQSQKDAIKNISDTIADEEKEQWRAEGNIMLIQAKREDVALQLEANFRERQMMAYKEVKDRLDYHATIAQTERRIQHKNLIEWVVKQVEDSITPQLEQDTLRSCISDLNAMSVSAK